MRNVKINEAESIFEPFWDSGESYPNHQKYTCLSQYRTSTNGAGKFSVEWQYVRVVMYPTDREGFPVCMERECKLDIREYDLFRLFASISRQIEFRVTCMIDGVEKEVLHEIGTDVQKEYTGTISGSLITMIRIEFRNLGREEVAAQLVWMGLSNSEKEQKMLAEESPYTPDWEGCFCDFPEIKPLTGLYFDEEELNELREKLKTPLFAPSMDRLRKKVTEYLKCEPEKDVGDFVNNRDRRFLRDREINKHDYIFTMDELAFVGIVDGNMDMLRMACRMALAVAHCKYLCDSFMGAFPGATWHHRSFTEAMACRSMACVLEFAGGLLTWHGKNIIYDAIIMKGLPRMDADLKTMDYIWTMNQGTVFAADLVIVLLALQKRYPRYAVRVEEAEKDLFTMWETYSQKDGGTTEGPGYWNYTIAWMKSAIYLLARYHNMTLEQYVPEAIRRSALYGESLMSDAGNCFIPVNDGEAGAFYSLSTISFMAAINAGDIWRKLNNEMLKNGSSGWEDLVYGRVYDLSDTSAAKKQEFISLPVSGHTTLRRETPDMGTVGLHAISGIVTFGHGHADKGSIVLEAGGCSLLIDRGHAPYSSPDTLMHKSEVHNMVTAVLNNKHLSQQMEDSRYSGIVLESKYENEVFSYATDVTISWNGIFKKNIREITSDNPYHYTIKDSLEIGKEYLVCFILNTFGEIKEENGSFIITDSANKLVVTARNWKPDKVEIGACGTDGTGRVVNRLCLYVGGAEEYDLITDIELSKEGL